MFFMSKEQSALLLLSLSIGLALTVDICEYQINGAYLSHPADCNKFVECQNGKTYRISSCPLGLHFNRFQGVCDLRQRAACDIEFVNFMNEETNCSACCAIYGCYVRPECPATSGTPTTVISPTTPVTTETSTAWTSTATPGTLSTPAKPETTSAPVTTSSTSASDIPDTPATSESSSSPETPHSTLTSIEPETTTETMAESSSSPETPYTTLTPAHPETPVTTDIPHSNQCSNNLTVCQKEPDSSSMHVNGTCNQYIVCAAGCAYIMSCPANLQYDVVKQQCDYPENVNCPWQTTASITGPSGVTCDHRGQCEKQRDGKLFASPNSDGYIICQCECEIERLCPEGTKFDAKLLTCAWKASKTDNRNENNKKYENDDSKTGTKTKYENGGKNTTESGRADKSRNVTLDVCSNGEEICKNQAEGTLLPVYGICNKFYKCNFGCPVEIHCPNNLIFNPVAEYCDYPNNYKCPWPFTALSGASACPSGIACASGGRCKGELDGTLLPSLTSCAKYVVCQCECEVERECAKNLYWDRHFLTCNYSANVTCELDL